MLSKEPEMLQTDAFAGIQRSKPTAAGALPRTPLRELQRFRDPLAGFNGSHRGVEGRGQGTRGGEGGEIQDGRGRRGDVDLLTKLISDAKWLPNRLNR